MPEQNNTWPIHHAELWGACSADQKLENREKLDIRSEVRAEVKRHTKVVCQSCEQYLLPFSTNLLTNE
jgi:hypothetical protein